MNSNLSGKNSNFVASLEPTLKVEQNIQRLKYLLSLYKMTVKELLLIISDGLSKPITEEEIIADEVKLSHLKRIDKIFNKGLHFYLDPKAPEQNKEASIFFRKSNFNVDLNLGAYFSKTDPLVSDQTDHLTGCRAW